MPGQWISEASDPWTVFGWPVYKSSWPGGNDYQTSSPTPMVLVLVNDGSLASIRGDAGASAVLAGAAGFFVWDAADDSAFDWSHVPHQHPEDYMVEQVTTGIGEVLTRAGVPPEAFP